MNSAGKALQKVCDQLQNTEKRSGWAKLVGRTSARSTANEVMVNLDAQDFGDLRRAVQGFETIWKGEQSQASPQPVEVARNANCSPGWCSVSERLRQAG